MRENAIKSHVELKDPSMNTDCFLKLASICLDRLASAGIDLSVVWKIAEFEAEMVSIGKRHNYPMISPAWHDFSSNEALGVLLHREGEVIGGVAACHRDLGRDSLSEHWKQSYTRLYGGGDKSPVSHFGRVPSEKIKGRVVYLGELYLEESARGGDINLGLVLHYLHVLSFLHWRPDWIYGFIRQRDVFKGKAAIYGFAGQYAGPQTWDTDAPGREDSEYLVTLAAEDLNDAVTYYARKPRLFCPDRLVLRSPIAGSSN